MWLANDSSNGVRVLAALIGLGVGLLVVLLIAWALSVEEAETKTAVLAPPVVTPAPEVPVVAATPVDVDLEPQLAKGRALDESEIDAWIEETKQLLARHRPGVLGYFSALGSRSFPDERARLDAHLARLETIVNG